MASKVDTASAVAAIRDAAKLVRLYRRQPAKRAAALALLGRTVRNAFNATEDFEPLLIAICDGLRPALSRRARQRLKT